jgi:hypothetical protein
LDFFQQFFKASRDSIASVGHQHWNSGKGTFRISTRFISSHQMPLSTQGFLHSMEA